MNKIDALKQHRDGADVQTRRRSEAAGSQVGASSRSGEQPESAAPPWARGWAGRRPQWVAVRRRERLSAPKAKRAFQTQTRDGSHQHILPHRDPGRVPTEGRRHRQISDRKTRAASRNHQGEMNSCAKYGRTRAVAKYYIQQLWCTSHRDDWGVLGSCQTWRKRRGDVYGVKQHTVSVVQSVRGKMGKKKKYQCKIKQEMRENGQ